MNVLELANAVIIITHVQVASLSFTNVHLVMSLILFMEFAFSNVSFVAAKLMIWQVNCHAILVKLFLAGLVTIHTSNVAHIETSN